MNKKFRTIITSYTTIAVIACYSFGIFNPLNRVLASEFTSSEITSYSNSDNSSTNRATSNLLESTTDTTTVVTDINDYNTNEIIVTYKDNSSSSESLDEIGSEVDTTKLTDQSVLISLENKKELSSTIKELSTDDEVASIQPNYTYKLLDTPTDKYYPKQWGLSNNGTFIDSDYNKAVKGIDMNVAKAWNVFTGGRKLIIAVIDTGVDYTHEDLSNVMWSNSSELSGDGKDNDGNGYIDDVHGWNFYSNNSQVYVTSSNEDDHGTHVAGIIGASKNDKGIVGVASNTNVQVMSVKALGGVSGSGKTSSIIKSIQYAEDNGAKICNLSFGVPYDDPALRTVIKNSKMLFVCASGNGNKNHIGYDIDTTPMYPASYEYNNIISVANIACNGELHSSSNYGVNSVDVAAPGTSIASTIVGNHYSYMTGTSMSTPMVSGVLAMVYAYYDGITLQETKDIVLSTIRKLPSLTGKVATGGIIDAYAALSLDETKVLSFDKTSPVISTKVSNLTNTYKKSLKITVKDPENNLSSVLYAKGTKTLDYFNKDLNGTKLSLKNNSHTTTLSQSSIYTIYAMDLAGNESIKTVSVSIKPPTKIAITSKKTLKIGTSYYLKPVITPSTTKTILSYKSSDSTIVSINKTTGKITAKKQGSAVIMVTTENGLTAKCNVTVVKK